MDGRADERTDEGTAGRKNGYSDGHTDERQGKEDDCLGAWTDGRAVGEGQWAGERTGERVGGRTDGWSEEMAHVGRASQHGCQRVLGPMPPFIVDRLIIQSYSLAPPPPTPHLPPPLLLNAKHRD